MDAVGINWPLAIAQLCNLGLLIGWIALAFIALTRLRRADLTQGVTLGWAALIILVPLLGAAAFMLAGPGRRS
jgi:hypothetical protein